MKAVVQTREYIKGEYTGFIYEKIIICNTDFDVNIALGIQEGRENGNVYKVLSSEYFADFHPLNYSKITKHRNFKDLKGG